MTGAIFWFSRDGGFNMAKPRPGNRSCCFCAFPYNDHVPTAQTSQPIDDLFSRLPDPVTAGWLLAGLVAVWLAMRIRRMIRARRSPRLNPNLMKYAGIDDASLARRREMAARILATSSTGQVAGYEIVRQIEAVFEDGHRTPAEAVEALKAAAAQRGANALINLAQQRTAAGRCTAQGDAVIIRPILPPAQRPPPRAT